MPIAKSKGAPSNKDSTKSKAKPSTSGTATPTSVAPSQDIAEVGSAAGLQTGKPDKAAYDAEQAKLKSEIDALQAKVAIVKEKISLATSSGTGNERRNALRTELDGIRGQQSDAKSSRGKILDQLKAKQEGIQKKIKDLQAAKSKTPFKTVAEVDAHIKNLEKQVESGNMKLVDEKRALQEISTSKRTRRTVETFEADQAAIEADRLEVDEIKKQLDDPELKAVSDRYDAIKAELDELKKESDEAYAGRSKLFEERDNLQAQLTVLFNQKRESAQNYKDWNDRYWNKVHEDRARRAEKARAQRAEEENQKKTEIAERLLEEASTPAFQINIEDCQTLIEYFQGKSGAGGASSASSGPLVARSEIEGVNKLEARKVEAIPEGAIVRKKKGDDDDAYFVGGKGKKGGKKAGSATKTAESPSEAAPSANAQLNIPLPTLSALLSLSIPPPNSSSDVPRVIEDLKTKKAWYEANQNRVTAENMAKAKADIQRLTNGAKASNGAEGSADSAPSAEAVESTA